LNAKTLHTLCVVGATDDAVARIQHLLDAQSAQLHARWRLAAHADAELLVIDPDSTYGHMDWLRAQAQGRCIVAFASQPEAYPNDACLRKPIDGGDLVAVLNRVGTTLPARPATPAAPAQPIAAPSTAAGTPTTTQPKQSLPAAGAPAVVASTPAEAPSASVRRRRAARASGRRAGSPRPAAPAHPRSARSLPRSPRPRLACRRQPQGPGRLVHPHACAR